MLLTLSSYTKKYVIYQTSQIDNKIVPLDVYNAPKDCVLHLMDNFDYQLNKRRDTFRLEYYPFFLNNNLPKCIIYHNTTLDMEFIKHLDIRIRFKTQGLATALHSFDRQIRSIGHSEFREQNLFKLDKKDSIPVVVNHNPIFSRLETFGSNKKYQSYYTFLIHMHSIFHFLYTHFEDKNKILFVPLHDKEIIPFVIYKKFYKNFAIPESYLTKFKSELFYLLGHLIMYSTVQNINDIKYNFIHKSDNITICFFNPDTSKSISINLGLFRELASKSSSLLKKLITTLHSISLDMPLEKTNKVLNQTEKQYENIDLDNEQELNKVKSSTISTTEKPEDIESTIVVTNKDELVSISKEDTLISKDSQKTSIDFVTNQSKQTLEFIDKQSHLTPAQKQRYKKMYLDSLNSPITIDGKSYKIKDLLNQKVDTKLSNIQDLSNKIDSTVMDKSYATNVTTNLHEEYLDKHFNQHLAKCIFSLSKSGLFFKKYEEETEKTDTNIVKHIRLTYTNIDGKTKTLKIKIPLPDHEGYFRYNGVKSYMKLQLVNLPITKINNYRVSLSSNYGKTIVERNTSIRYNFANHFISILEKYNKDNPDKPIKFKKHVYTYHAQLPFEYTTIGKNIKYVQGPKYEVNFSYDTRFNSIGSSKTLIDKIKKAESKYGVLVGKSRIENHIFLFMNEKNIITEVDVDLNKVLSEGFLLDYVIPPHYQSVKPEWINLLILDKKLPLIFILGYKFGLKRILDDIKIPYRTVPKGHQLNLLPYEIPIRFNDVTLIIPRYPITKSWIICGLLAFNNLTNYSFSDLDIEDTYYDIISQKGLSINYIKGIDNFFNFFIDPITEEILKELGEPTTPKELLYRAVEILNTEYHEEPAAVKNFRVKSLEKINGVIYNEITKQYAQYLNDKSKNTSFTINTEAVLMKILQDQSVILAEETNPIHYLKERTALTHGGFLGREADSFVERDRKYPSDGLGIISEAVPDNPKVGFSSFAPLNMLVDNSLGLFKQNKDISKLGAGNILSVSGVLMPFSTNDDAKRLTFISIQLSHHVPCKNSTPCRIATGFESIVGDMSSPLYAVIAKDDGKIEYIDDQTFKVKYKKLGTYIYKYGKVEGEVSSFMINHHITLNNLKVNQSIKKGDVLAYNTGFFKYDPVFKQLNWCHGVSANIAIIDTKSTLEDASAFTQEFLNKFDFDTVYKRVIKITPELAIKDMVSEGTEVDYNTPLVTLEYQDIQNIDIENTDSELEEDDILGDLNKIVTKAKHKGYIHKIKMYHTLDITDYHPTVQKVLRSYYRKINQLKKSHKDVINVEDININPKVEPGTRIKKTELNEGELVIIFYINEVVPSTIGDKFVIDNSLKTVVGEIIDYDFTTKSGIKLDGIFGGASIFNRIITSPIKLGILERIMESIEKKAIELYFGEKEK